jgi:Fur family ferric uptake transcriptional regulator
MVTDGSQAAANGAHPPTGKEAGLWSQIRGELRSRGLRWTPQRRLILDVLEATDGHITGAELVERCRERDADTTPSTAYRTLDVLEELGYVRHSHSATGREEFHVLPAAEHGHLECRECGGSWELDPAEATAMVEPLRARYGFAPDVGHITISGLCADCSRSTEPV